MNKNVEKPVHTGAGAKAAHLGGVSQLGNKVGNHVTNKSTTGYRGDPLFAGPGYNPTKYGNEVALRASGSKAGPGADRNVMPCGGQGMHGSANPGKPSANRDILSEFGPESSRGR